jgi:hypothetical protein
MSRQFRWPTDSRPVVEVDGRIRTAAKEAALQAESKRLDTKRFASAETWQHLCELGAQWCEGKILNNPGHPDRDPETIGIAGPLAHMNRQGFLTVGSQPGEGRAGQAGHQQKAMVEGWVPAVTLGKLRDLIRGTRLRMQVHEGRLPRRHDASGSFDMTRHVYPDGTVHVFSDGGVIPGRNSIGIDYGHEELIDDQDAAYVIVHDPEWGDHSLLWDRLGQRDWDSPAPTAKTVSNPASGAGATTTSGGAGVSHASEGNAQIAQAGQDIEGAMGAIQEIVNQLESAQQNLLGAAEESQHSEADAAQAALQQAVTAANDLQQQVGAAKQAVEDVRL